jgi:SAM-dependent methyltransferase
MSGGTAMEAPPEVTPRAGLELVHTGCPLCGSDEAEPVAVGNDLACRVTGDSFLMLSCAACGLLYLDPRPAIEERARLYPPSYFALSERSHRSGHSVTKAVTRDALRRSASGPAPARILEVAYGAGLHLDLLRRFAPSGCVVEATTPHETLAAPARARGFTVHQGRAQSLNADGGAYDLLFLLHSMEHCDSPLDELCALRELLRAGGRLIILTPNAESPVSRRFRGRHWAGYDFPRHPCLFGPTTLRRLAAATGFEVERLDSLGDSGMWADSAGNLLRDWGAPPWLTRIASGGILAITGAAARVQPTRRRGTDGPQLRAVLRKAVETRA